MEVHVPGYKDERICMCVLGVSIVVFFDDFDIEFEGVMTVCYYLFFILLYFVNLV
jgi:hypothetical protein